MAATDQAQSVQLDLSCQAAADGHAVVTVSGEIDIATADHAYAYIRDVIDELRAPVSVDLAGLTFCDARGLGVLARLAHHAEREGGRLRLTSPRPSLVMIMRITGLDEAFPELGSIIASGRGRRGMRR